MGFGDEGCGGGGGLFGQVKPPVQAAGLQVYRAFWVVGGLWCGGVGVLQ